VIMWVLDEEATHEQKVVVGFSASLSCRPQKADRLLLQCSCSARELGTLRGCLETRDKFSPSHKSISSYDKRLTFL
jgi:hypothetical protein